MFSCLGLKANLPFCRWAKILNLLQLQERTIEYFLKLHDCFPLNVGLSPSIHSNICKESKSEIKFCNFVNYHAKKE